MDKKDEFIQVPTLSFPAYKEAKRPRWLLIFAGIVIVAGILLMLIAAMSYWG